MQAHTRAVAALIVFFSLITGGGWILAGAERYSQPNYGFIHQDGEKLVVNFGAQMIWLDASGVQQAAWDLADLGLNPVGDFAVLAPGTLLIYHQPEAPGVWYDLRSFFRMQDIAERLPAGKDRQGEGFYRCVLALSECAPFGQNMPRLPRSFRLAADDRHIYLAHTSAFELYQFDRQGRELARTPADRFRFPNALLLVDGALWLADTNNHRLVQVATEAPFGAEQQVWRAELAAPHRWPHQMAWDPHGQRFLVVLGDNGMANGLLVGVTEQRVTPLPGVAATDPLAMYLQGDTLWLTDYAEGQLQRYRLLPDQVTPLPAHASERLHHLEQARDRAVARAKEWQWGFGLGFVVVFVAGLVAAWRLEQPQTRAALSRWRGQLPQPAPGVPLSALPQGRVFWLQNRYQRYLVWRKPLAMAAGIALILGVLALALTGSSPSAFAPVVGVLLGVLVPLIWLADSLLRYTAGQALGIDGAHLVAKSPPLPFYPAREARVPLEEVSGNAHYLLVGPVLLQLGNGQRSCFDQQELTDHLWPRLAQARQLSQSAMLRELWRRGFPPLWLPLVVTLGVLVLGLSVIPLLA